VLFGMMCGALVGISRLALHNHSTAEVIAGWALGALVSMGFILLFRSSKPFVLNRWLIVLSMIVIMAAPYAEPAPTQGWMVDVALFISGHDQPCSRSNWK
jgi:membrane-associated phospholipid phosphatase